MIENILSMFIKDEIISYEDISERLHINKYDIKFAIEHLERVGFIEKITPCESSRCGNCSKCSSRGKIEPGNIWSITGEGRKYFSVS